MISLSVSFGKIKECMSKVWIKLLVIILLQLVFLSYSITAIQNINGRTTTSYLVEHKEYTMSSLAYGETKEFTLIPYDYDMIQYNLPMNVNGTIDGLVTYRILDSENTIMQESTANLTEDGRLSLDVTGVDLKGEEEYQLQITSWSNAEIQFFEEEGNQLRAEQVFTFRYGELYKSIVLALNVVLFITMVFLAIKPNVTKSFVTMAVVLGIIEMVMVIPCSAPDEWRHFARAYDLAQGHIKAESWETDLEKYGFVMPVCQMPEEFQMLNDLGSSNSEAWHAETNYNLYYPAWRSMWKLQNSGEYREQALHATGEMSPLGYLPQAIFIAIGNLFHMNAISIYYMAKLGNLVFSILMMLLVLKLVPSRKNLFMILYFVPGITFLRASCSTDTVTYAFALLLVAFFFYLWENEKKMSTVRYIAVLAITMIFLASIKLPFMLLGFLFLMLSAGRKIALNDKNRKIVFIEYGKRVLIICALCVVSYLIYHYTIVYLHADSATEFQSLVGDSVIGYALAHPVEVLNLLVQTYLSDFMSYFTGCISYLNVPYVFLAYIVLVAWTALNERPKKPFTIGQRSYVGLVACGLWAAVVFVFYTVSVPGSGVITGMQGRYMNPILPLMALMIPHKQKTNKCMAEFMPLILTTINMVFILCVFKEYW